ncbi:uncharacterized protein A4U43_C02F2350 [Asparagus officinalis]|uniref:Uncharacterized protein n=2 Tax=Asparagus officinalis TaxID=4686 RepID=A0A5P1FHY4_ASPOF|nr:uncharacterized protein A4U43_C02F2350 [Asparagus officinalis]
MESFNSVVSELEKSRAQENILEETIKKLQEELALELESTHVKYQEEEIRNMVLILSAYELEENLRNKSISQEANLQSALKDTQAEITALKAKLSEKDAHSRSVSEMNERLQSEIKERVGEIKSSLGSKLMDKETELQGIMHENKLLKLKIKEREERDKNSEVLITELDLVRVKEQEATMKFEIAKEELEMNSRMAETLGIQLDEALAVKEETESELKRLRVQSEQWRKAAETAMAVLRTGKEGDFLEKLMSSPFSDNLDDESVKTRNHNVLRWMGELWKKGQK